MNTLDKIETLLRHIQMVQNNCIILGKRLIKEGKEDIGIELIKNGLQHDASKFDSFEFNHLWYDSDQFASALTHHQTLNYHHPEAYSKGIHGMADQYLAEMVCDITARAQEFGTDIRHWIEMCATSKYNFKMTDPVGIKIEEYLDLLLSKKFK